MADAPVSAAPAATPTPQSTPNTTPESATGQPVNAGQAPATGTPATPAAAKAEIKRMKSLKLKIDGAEVDEPLPFEMDDTPETREYMTRQLQMGKMGQKRAQEAADLRKQVEKIGEYLNAAKGDKKKMRALIKELGTDEKELAAAIIEEEIANSQKSPDQLAKEKLEDELRELKEQREREKNDFNAKELERHQNAEMERYDVLVSQALDTVGIPKKAASVRRMSDYLLLALENGIDLHPNDVANIVKQEIEGDMQELINSMGEDKAEAFIGKDILSKIRKKNVAKAKAAGTVPNTKKAADVGAKPSTTPATPGKKQTLKQMFGV
jgi:hypothetical protein